MSILFFGNPVTWVSAFGTLTCISGVFAYNHARQAYPYRPQPALPMVWDGGRTGLAGSSHGSSRDARVRTPLLRKE